MFWRKEVNARLLERNLGGGPGFSTVPKDLEQSRKYLVYQITNKINKMIYIGVHITRNINDGYMGSGRKITKAISEYGISNFEKVILYQFDNESDMIKKESELVNDSFLKRGDVYNIIIGGGFITKDLATVRDVDGNTFDVNVSDPRISSGELVGITKGNVTACDEFGNFFYIPVDDERYNLVLFYTHLHLLYVQKTKGT